MFVGVMFNDHVAVGPHETNFECVVYSYNHNSENTTMSCTEISRLVVQLRFMYA